MARSFEMGPSTRALYVISVAAELAGVHPQTLRIYERKGLVGPARTDSGIRRYSDADIALLRRIQELTTAGVNLEGVRRILALEAEVFQLSHELERVRADAAEYAHRLHSAYQRELEAPSPTPTTVGSYRSAGPTDPPTNRS